MRRLTTNLDQYSDYFKIIRCLIQVIDKKHYLKKKHVNECQNQDYCWDLIKQTLRWYYRYIEVLNGLLEKPIKKKNRELELLLIVGLVRINHLQEPNYHVVNHSVDLARALKFQWADALVNKVLRQYILDQKHYEKLYKNKPSLMMAHPGWLIKATKKSWPEHLESIVLSNQCIPQKWLNISSSQKAQHLLSKYKDQVSTTDILDTALMINHHSVLDDIVNTHDDWGYIQDISAQMIHFVLKQIPKPNKVLDACAAPGGKAYILLRDFPNISLTCTDVDDVRLATLNQNLKRFNIANQDISVLKKNWCEDDDDMGCLFDLVVLDAPCSGSGVIKRHPEKKFNPWDLSSLCQVQSEMLKNLWSNLVAGGYLIYSTCSILQEENSDQILSFISSREDVEVKLFSLPVGLQADVGWQILPSQAMDGHYFVILKKLS